MKVDYGAAGAQVDAREAPATMPPGFKHAILAVGQVSLVMLICAWVGIFTARDSTNEFLGHLLPGSILVASAILTMAGPADMTRLVRAEGWIGFVAGAAYVLGDTFYSHPPYGVFDGAGQAEQFHVGFMSLIAAVGLFALLYVRVAGKPTALHVVVLTAAFALFVGGHHQHSEASALAHNACAVFAVVGAIFRVMGRRVEYGVCLFLTAYLFFAGQVGFGAFMARFHIDGVPWISAWAALAVFVAAAYMAAFPDAARRAG